MTMTFQEIRIIATGPCITNQLRDVNTICRRSWYIASHIWKIYANLELLIDKTSSIYLYVKLKALASWIFLCFTSFWRNSDSYEYKNKSDRRGTQFVPIGMPTTCWNSVPQDPLIITNMTSNWITQNYEMSLKSSDYRTKKRNLLWIIFYLQLLIYNKSQVYDFICTGSYSIWKHNAFSPVLHTSILFSFLS